MALRQGLVCVPLPFPCAGCLPMASALLCPRVFSAVGAHSAQRARGLGPQELSPTKGVGGGGERLPRPSAGQSFAVVTQLAPFLMSLSFLAHSPHCDSTIAPQSSSRGTQPKTLSKITCAFLTLRILERCQKPVDTLGSVSITWAVMTKIWGPVALGGEGIVLVSRWFW